MPDTHRKTMESAETFLGVRRFASLRSVCVSLTLALLLTSCSKHEERSVTDWLNVDVIRSASGTNGVIVLGRNEEVYRVRNGSRWSVLGSGSPCRHMVLGDGKAVIIDLNDRKGEQIIYEGEETLRPVREVFGHNLPFFVTPDRAAVDFYECTVPAKPAGCRAVTIYRHELTGKLVETFHADLKDEYPECQVFDSPRGFDSAGTPYLFAQCARDSERVACLLVAPRKAGLFLHAVPKDKASQCGDFRGLGVSLRGLETFEVFQ